ncbi:purine-binding chemotaxis protein CheW [Roseomonas rosea]|uniref:Chemotaxis protein CheW n=1 Tax=Muricoccus roseus TaxID=198092 RepID=A0A1M6PF34_9PROT|nr:chemotaxis protein CheW [Roseomonas rosea]SHK06568.1 purine-binding chemotaxis protein CheW [Roseomonas rosea]
MAPSAREPSAQAAGAAEALTVMVAGQELALPAGAVQEVLRPRPVTRVPHAPPGLLGLINLRGAVLPVASLAQLMELEAAPPSAAARIVVVNGRAPVGLLVDSVSVLGGEGGARRVELDALLVRGFGSLARRGAAGQAPGGAAAAGAVPEARAEELALIGFVLAGQDYALPLDKVVAVARLPEEVTAVPRTGQAMLGVTAFRGGLLPLVSPHALLGLPAGEMDAGRGRVLVVRMGRAAVGLVVDRMTAILRLPESAIDPVPPVLTRGAGEARVEAIGRLDGGRRLVSVLSPARLFDDQTASRILADAREAEGMAGTVGEAAEQFVVFRLGEEHYGLPIAAVDEVARRPESLTRIPRAPAFVEGVMNLRGSVVPVIDQRRRFGTAGVAEGRGRRIVVVTLEGLRAGFAVDAVTEVLSLPVAALAPAPELAAGEATVFDRIATVERDGRMILLIEPKALLDAAERDLLAAIAAKAAAGEARAGSGGRSGARSRGESGAAPAS